jgi:Peptidase family M28
MIALRVLALLAFLLLLGAAMVTQPLVGKSAAWKGPASDPARLRETVQALVDLGPRNDERGMARAATFIEARLEDLGFTPAIQRYKLTAEQLRSTRRSNEPDLLGEYSNIVVDVGPLTEERVVVGAHYDARRAYPGADDNASGTAALLELARMLEERPPAMRVELVFYSNEERGLIGSTNARKEGVRAMFSLEMLGCFGEPQKFPLPGMNLLYPGVSEAIVVVGRLNDFTLVRSVKRALRGSGARVSSIDAPEAIPGIGNSDHSPYWHAGIPAVMITDTAWYRNPRYHTAADTPDTLNYEKMALITDGVAAAVRDLSAR